MRILIVEDEPLAVDRLRGLIKDYDSQIEVLAEFDCIECTVDWLNEGNRPDLAFFDIQLADGLSFSIFEQVDVSFPVIFTTAYDEYALRAFKVNSLDYLLKPIKADELAKAFSQYDRLKKSFQNSPPLDKLADMLSAMRPKKYKERFVVKSTNRLINVPGQEVLYFFSENKMTWLRRDDGRKHMINFTMDQLQDKINPSQFFRINRKLIVALDGIKEVIPYSNSRLKVVLDHGPNDDRAVVSRDRVPGFKDWWEGN